MDTTNRTVQDDGPLTNGQSVQRINGHAKESAPKKRGGGPAARRARAQAAPDDAHGTPVAPAPGPPAASATHDACADAACVSNSEKSHAPSAAGTAGDAGRRNKKEPPPALPAGELPLPEDAGAFVNALHAKADLVEAGRRLLNSEDEKIIKAIWDRLVNLKYGHSEDACDEEPRRVIVGMPRPTRPDPPPQPGT